MNKIIVIVVLLFSFTKGFCQTESSKSKLFEDYLFFPSIGVSYQKQLVGEVGVLLAKCESGGMCNPSIIYGYKLATEFNFDQHNFYMAPKLSLEADLFFSWSKIKCD
jgi:hypothetical protein